MGERDMIFEDRDYPVGAGNKKIFTSGRTKYWDFFDQVHRNLSEYYFH